jgi:hypothetical protein
MHGISERRMVLGKHQKLPVIQNPTNEHSTKTAVKLTAMI